MLYCISLRLIPKNFISLPLIVSSLFQSEKIFFLRVDGDGVLTQPGMAFKKADPMIKDLIV